MKAENRKEGGARAPQKVRLLWGTEGEKWEEEPV